jgi:signal transduction histidine kinase
MTDRVETVASLLGQAGDLARASERSTVAETVAAVVRDHLGLGASVALREGGDPRVVAGQDVTLPWETALSADQPRRAEGPDGREWLLVSLGEEGVLAVADPDEQSREAIATLATTATAALERIERERRLRERNDRLEEFASIVSHDLRNPLESLTGELTLIEETGDAGHVQNCRRQVDRMNRLVDDLLTLARQGEAIGETEPVGLAEFVEDCWAGVATGDASLVVETDRVVGADRSRLRQLLENLLRNAVEHAGPEVTVTVGSRPGGFYVADDGPGIAAGNRVFESGYSSEPEGTGVGLAIVEQVATAHDWTVELGESEAGGARFDFSDVDLFE